MGTGTASLLLGAPHRRLGGVTPYFSLWFYEDPAGSYWCTEQVPQGRVSWTPRTPERSLADGLVLLLALTSTPRDAVPQALSQMAAGLPWHVGHVDVSTWRHYDAELLDTLVAETDPPGKLVVSLLPETTVADLGSLERLDWDIDVLAPSTSRRRADPDIKQTPLPRRPARPAGTASSAATAALAGMAGASAAGTAAVDGLEPGPLADPAGHPGAALPGPRGAEGHPDAVRGA